MYFANMASPFGESSVTGENSTLLSGAGKYNFVLSVLMCPRVSITYEAFNDTSTNEPE